MQSQTTKIAISGYYGCDNFGDETILSVIIKKMQDLKKNIVVFSKNPEKTSSNYNIKAVYSFDYLKVFNTIRKSDILISGGGSLLQDATSIKSLFYYLAVIFCAIFFRKKVIIFAQGIGPINNKFGAKLTQFLLKKCSYVSVRDEKSLFLLRGWGIKTNLVCDPLWDLKLANSNTKEKVGIQLRSFKTLSKNLLVKLADQIVKDFSNKKIEIYSFQDSLDLEVCTNFKNRLKLINPAIEAEVISGLTSKDVLTKLSELEYMIAMRFHACLVALKYGVKTLAICYDEKVENIAKESQIPSISMLANEDYDLLFNEMKNLDKQKLIEFAKTKQFDWTEIEERI